MRRVRWMVLLLLVSLAGCSDDQERRCHLAVKSLVAAPAERAAGELDKVVRYGRYALPDIEQEFHAAPVVGRRRLLEALERIRSAEAVPFLAFVARWEKDRVVREQAAYLAGRLRGAAH